MAGDEQEESGVDDNEDGPMHDLEYEQNDFVAVRCPESEGNPDPFWIGKIVTVEFNQEDVAFKLLVQWYEVDSGVSPWNGRYKPSKFRSGTRKGDLWQQLIDVDAILVKFSNLTNADQIASRDAKKIQEAIN